MEDDQIAHDAPRVVSADYSSVLLLEIKEKDYCYHRSSSLYYIIPNTNLSASSASFCLNDSSWIGGCLQVLINDPLNRYEQLCVMLCSCKNAKRVYVSRKHVSMQASRVER